ncbi:DUF2631 domain-containing protein [Rhodococcus sp. NPDC019627]|uniref:DUF2631 domain-containing protein n=1 Tax=Rhodococcus oxybenzonivorans TaxID=1990687 RepID=A0A2S2C433_9NOCA|nr:MULTISPECIES: DUF2631 domain-containing protein [Rhodococcus]AWK75641.1 hypothetical protein CBI38_17910 [Rhodococcus oxybenzonivorans]MDV7352425.1 DUF2631 domain-containing protein [Rhodococcus oxybenzonivorans]QHE72147.1 hypothetical protein GFS60_05775 [Rhodococcus sp. WAY2]QTJ69195.1 DUF2631 domain-containing protein [Rhodococcus sp. ZPP]
MAGTQLEPSSSDPVVAAHVDTAEVPSAAWGWSGEAPKTFRFLGWFFALFLLLMIIGNHTGRVEDLWLVGCAGLMVVVLVRDILQRRKPR